MFVGAAACVTLAAFGIRFLLITQTILGPPDSDAASAGADWFPDAKGGGSSSVDFNSPATKGGYDFVLNNTVAGADNWACWRCPLFSVGPATNGARPITLSFTYKLDDPVAAKNIFRVQLRFCRATFWDPAGTNFIGERNVRVGAWTGDSAMTGYRTVTVGGILAPPDAQTIDIGIYANINPDEPWVSGTGRLANFSVTTTTHSLLLNTVVGTVVVATIGALIMLLVRIWRGRATVNQSQPPAQIILKSFCRGFVLFAGLAVCVMLAGFAAQFLFKKQVMLGPPGSGTSSAIANWIPDTKGGGSVSADFSDPATRGGCDFVLSNSVAAKGNNAECRCPLFPLGPAADGARPITFSFAYKLGDPVAAGDNMRVQLRFWDATGNNFINERVIYVGARTGDSGMTGYRIVTVNGIKAPRKAQMADVWVNANCFEPWASGSGQFDNISVTTTPHSLLFRVGVAGTGFIGIGALFWLLIRFWHWSTPVYQSSPIVPPAPSQPAAQTMNTNSYKSFRRGVVMFAGVAAGLALAALAIYFLFQKPMMIGPANPGAEDNSDGWWVGASGGARSFFTVDHTDPGSGDYDFTLGNTNLDGENTAEWRSVMFPLGPAATGARPITFSFAYKLPDEVKAGDNMLVQLRFFDHGTNYLSGKSFWLGARSGDSAMTRYKTITVGGILAPRRAEVADVTTSINDYGEHWSSGTGRVDSFSVTIANHSSLFKAGAVAGVMISIGALIILLVGFWRRIAPARQ
jgi:hypothetical protein